MSIAKAVEELVEQSPFLALALSEGIINYSALARKLRPYLKARIKRRFSDEAVIMALKRMELRHRKDLEFPLKKAIAEATYSIYSPVYDLIFDYTMKDISSIKPSENACFMFIVGTRCASLITDDKSLVDEVKNRLGNRIIKCLEGLALFRVMLKDKYVEQPGIIYLLSKTFAKASISILELGSSYREISFVIKEKEIAKAIEAFRALQLSLSANFSL